jgi:hypothetical protein
LNQKKIRKSNISNTPSLLEVSPEKAGVGGSIPSLATIFTSCKSAAYSPSVAFVRF